MSFQEIIQKYSPIFKQYWLPITLGCIALIFLLYGLIALSAVSAPEETLMFSQSKDTETQEKTIIVDVQGAVVKPGVYTLAENSRIQNALIAASGLADTADREWVAKYINLAARVTDGVKIYIPQEGENGESIKGIKSIRGIEGEININTASISELDSLSGIGEVTAQKIIDNRPYSSVDDLLTKKVVSKSVFEKIKARISIY